MKWDLEHVAAVLGEPATGDGVVSSVVIDSRRAGPGKLFFGLRGERFDGSDFAEQAAGAGSAVVVRRGARPPGAAGFEVDDPWQALLDLAVARRDELAAPVVAITGSSGKTSTKDLAAAALGPGSHASPKSFNNEAGVPLTILSAPDGATALVVEVGSRGAGHIARLMPAVRPDVAVITNIGRAHLGEFGDVAGVRRAKWELVEALGASGIAVLPATDVGLVAQRGSAPMLTFADGLPADVSAVDVSLDESGRPSGVLMVGDESIPFALTSAGRHQVLNLAAAVAAATAVGVPASLAASRAAQAAVSPWRMEVSPGRITVVNDAYNANPDSMASALRTVAAMPGRHIAVLGQMHELGEHSADAHAEVGELAASLGYARVVVVGDDPGIASGAGGVARSVPDVAAAIEVLRGDLGAGDVVLVKASRAEGLEVLAEGLVAEFGT